MEPKTHVVWYRNPHKFYPEYLVKVGATAEKSEWSEDKQSALLMTSTRAWKVSSKFNKGLDAGVPWRYGFGVY